MIMKKLLTLFLVPAVVFTLSGCGKDDSLEKMKKTTAMVVENEAQVRNCVETALGYMETKNIAKLSKLLASGNAKALFEEDGLLYEEKLTPATVKSIKQFKRGNSIGISVTVASVPRKADYDITVIKRKNRYLIQSVFRSTDK